VWLEKHQGKKKQSDDAATALPPKRKDEPFFSKRSSRGIFILLNVEENLLPYPEEKLLKEVMW